MLIQRLLKERTAARGMARLSPGQIAQIARTVRGIPEVTVKVTGGAKSVRDQRVRYRPLEL